MAKDNVFDNLESRTKPRDQAWDNWAKFSKVGDKVQGYIRDAFYRAAEGDFGAQRGITLEQIDGKLINVGIKRFPFILDKTNDLRIGDPLAVEFIEQKAPARKGISGVKLFAFYGKNLPENAGNPTVLELDPVTPVAGEASEAEDNFNKIEGEEKTDDQAF